MALCVLSPAQVAEEAVKVKKVDQHPPPPPEEVVHAVEETAHHHPPHTVVKGAHQHPLHAVQVFPSLPVMHKAPLPLLPGLETPSLPGSDNVVSDASDALPLVVVTDGQGGQVATECFPPLSYNPKEVFHSTAAPLPLLTWQASSFTPLFSSRISGCLAPGTTVTCALHPAQYFVDWDIEDQEEGMRRKSRLDQ